MPGVVVPRAEPSSGTEPAFTNPFGAEAGARAVAAPAVGSPFLSTPRSLDEKEFEAIAASATAITTSLDLTQKVIEKNRYEANRFLSGATLRHYLIDVETVEAFLKGTQRFFKVAEYGAILRNIDRTDGLEQSRYIGEFIVQGARDIASKGFETFGLRLIGQKAVAVLGTVTAYATITFTSEPITRQPAEIVDDPRTSLREKQQAMAQLWSQYEKFGQGWQPAQKLELAELSGKVYLEATKQEK